MTLLYDERNRNNLSKLAANTKIAALNWYEFCVSNGIQILIYETIRSVEAQKANVVKGASQTMKSYHLVGQALDWVLVNDKGECLWNGYKSTNAQKAIKYARQLGFESGYDWGWDAPHLQYEYKGYGTDTFCKLEVSVKEKNFEDKELVELNFSGPTVKTNLISRTTSKATAELINAAAKELLGYKDKVKGNGLMLEGDLVGVGLEVAVAAVKENKQYTDEKEKLKCEG